MKIKDVVLWCNRNGQKYIPTLLQSRLLTYDFVQAGIITFSTSIIKGGVEKFALKQPIFLVNISSLALTLIGC